VVARLLPLGEQVVNVPSKLSARMRVYAIGRGRKTNDTNAHSIALVGVRLAGLRSVAHVEALEMLRSLVDRRHLRVTRARRPESGAQKVSARLSRPSRQRLVRTYRRQARNVGVASRNRDGLGGIASGVCAMTEGSSR